MQIIHKNKDEGGSNRRTNLVGIVICIGEISRYMKGECLRGFRGRNVKIYDSRRVFDRSKEEV